VQFSAYQIDAFTNENNGGNAAGVLLNAEYLTTSEMQRIATKLGFSETAFVSGDKEVDFHVRFFTPNSEVDFCGHATLAVFSLMFQKKLINAQTYIQRTKAGNLAVTIEPSGYVEMNQALPSFIGEIPLEEIAPTLNVTADVLLVDNLPIELISTGLPDIMVPVRSGQLDKIKPDFAKISALSKKYHAIGYHLFEINPRGSAFTANCRNFAPLVDIDEESATGSACGALASYLTKHKVISQNHYVFEQGRALGCSSRILAKIETNKNQIISVKVGGFAKLSQELHL